MSDTVNLFELLEASNSVSRLELIRLDESETAVIPFTPHGERVHIHFCKEPEINAYVLCNAEDCVLCRIGKKKDERILIPAYVPTTDSIGVLPVSTSLRPNALLPQLAPVLKSGRPTAVFIKRDGYRFTVSTKELPEDANGGDVAIKYFAEEHKAGRVSLRSVYQTIPNEQLAGVSEISRILDLKGIRV